MMNTLVWSCTMNGELTSHTVDLTHWNSTHRILITVGTMNWGTLPSSSSSSCIFRLLLYVVLSVLRYVQYLPIQYTVCIVRLCMAAGGGHAGQEW